MKYNIIGDTHGRTTWKHLVKGDCVNIFVGDYFSPYDKTISFEEQMNNFMDIVIYKMKHPETIMLIGNHDDQHWKNIAPRVSRFDYLNQKEIENVFEENKDYLQVAYSIENKVLVTHAGVSSIWYERRKYKTLFTHIINCNYDDEDEYYNPYFDKMVPNTKVAKFSTCNSPEEAYNMYYTVYYPEFTEENKKPRGGELLRWNDTLWRYNNESGNFEKINATPDNVASFVNSLWDNGVYGAFNFDNNCDPNDCYGESYKQGPMWIRPTSLSEVNIFENTDYWQVVGHTMFKNVTVDEKYKLAFVDCLQYSNQSLIYDAETKEFYINEFIPEEV